ncbi:hypothetical protein LJB42_000709 [Komagataella kurtzmanii]|nr:hypothetical protein LJB42_000709 [Komagataella kurtzmanii]
MSSTEKQLEEIKRRYADLQKSIDESKKRLKTLGTVSSAGQKNHYATAKPSIPVLHRKQKMLNVWCKKNATEYRHKNRIDIDGSKYVEIKNASRLVPVSHLDAGACDDEKKITIDNREYVRQKTGSFKLMDKSKEIQELCIYFVTTGNCARKSSCRYLHDANMKSLCKEFLKGTCYNAYCTLSHKPTQFNSPSCKFYNTGFCSNENCSYTHKKDSSEAAVCRPFAVNGICPDGMTCKLRHEFICPEFDESGTCHIRFCALPHPSKKASTTKMFNNVRNEDNHADNKAPLRVDTTGNSENSKLWSSVSKGLESLLHETNNHSNELSDLSEDLDSEQLPQKSFEGFDGLEHNDDYVKIT